MSNVKERILGAVTVMNEKDAEKVWNLILATFALANAEETEATTEEIQALNAYHSGDLEYRPAVTQEDLMKELDL